MTNWASLLDRADRLHPDAAAIVAEGGSWTFGDVAQASRSVANGLRDMGVEAGDRMLIIGRNIPEYLVLVASLARMGAVAVPANFRFSVSEAVQVANDCGATAIAVDRDFADLGEQLCQRVTTIGVRVGLEGAPRPGWRSFGSLLASGGRDAEPQASAADDLARIMYTSGATGRAKGVQVTHGMWAFNTMAQVRALDVLPHDRILVTAPMHHVGGFDLPGPGAWMVGRRSSCSVGSRLRAQSTCCVARASRAPRWCRPCCTNLPLRRRRRGREALRRGAAYD